MSKRSLVHLFIPGLLGPLPPDLHDHVLLQFRAPALERLLARGRQQSRQASHWLEQFGELFQQPPGELPAGALGWLGEGFDPGASYWLRADPVHLQAGSDQLILFDASLLSLRMEEATQLVASCNQLLRDDGLELYAPNPQHWYLRSDQPILLQTTPLAVVAGRPLDAYMPQGAQATHWLGLMTELQMLLHQAPLNQQRTAQGALAINSVWFWGAGAVPEQVAGDWQKVYANDPIARGLARQAGIEPEQLPKDALQLPGLDRTLLLETSLAAALQSGDLERWGQEMVLLDQRIMSPLLRDLQAGKLAKLVLETDGVRINVDRRGLRQFWRRARPVRHYLEY